MDHFHVGNLRICHVLDAKTRYSAGTVIADTGMNSTIGAVDSHSISPFGPPNLSNLPKAFANKGFTEFLSLHGIKARLAPARRHIKNDIESKHKVIRDVFLRTKSNNADFFEIVAAQQAIRLSNDLCGNDTCSAHELAKCFKLNPEKQMKIGNFRSSW